MVDIKYEQTLPQQILLAAVSTLAVWSTIVGDFPPSSRVVDIRFSAAFVATFLPTSVLPKMRYYYS